MKARAVLVVSLLLLAALVVAEGRIVWRRDRELDALRTRAAELAQERAALQRTRDASVADLAEAQRQHDALPAGNRGTTVASERATETAAWLGRVKQLRTLLDARPADRIPEMRWLTERDWLRVSRTSELETDEGRRRALAALRSAAMGEFALQLQPALLKFAKAAPSGTPAGASVLAAYSSPPIDPLILERYELLDHRGEAQPQWEWTVQNRTALDPDFEWRQRLDASRNGSFAMSSGHGPWMWIQDLPERMGRATVAYREANPGKTPSGIADIVPFIQPPLSPATAERLIDESRLAKKW